MFGAKKRVVTDRAQARKQFLALRPMRNPVIAWEEVEGGVVLTITPRESWKTRLLTLLLPLSEDERKKRVVLDPIAADVWKRCDGKTNVGAIMQALQKGYNLGAREAELSLQQFFQTLGKRGFVAFVDDRPPGEPLESAPKKRKKR